MPRLARNLAKFRALIALVRQHQVQVVAIEMPVPARFLAQLPGVAAFNTAISSLIELEQVPFRDFSRAMDEPRYCFDTDHLNRAGMTEFFNRHLTAVLTAPL